MGSRDDDWSLLGLIGSVLAYPFQGAWATTRHMASVAATRATQLPTRALEAATAVKDKMLPPEDPVAKYREYAADIREKYKDELPARVEKKATPAWTLFRRHLGGAAYQLGGEIDEYPSLTFFIKRTLEVKQAKQSALQHLEQAGNEAELKLKLDEVKRWPNYKEIKSGLFSHRTANIIAEAEQVIADYRPEP